MYRAILDNAGNFYVDEATGFDQYVHMGVCTSMDTKFVVRPTKQDAVRILYNYINRNLASALVAVNTLTRAKDNIITYIDHEVPDQAS